jgi:serine/threonine-protein kinase
VIHRICPTCDKEITVEESKCPTCGSRLVEIRDEADTIVGTVIDQRFEVRDKLGQGGMGTVYRAWQRSVGREVAIKLMDRSFSRDPMGVRRFLREARLASQLSQPNTVSVFDFGQADDGRLFIAMELIKGKTLYQLIQDEGAFSIERTRRIGLQICDALEAAHTLGIIHRDLKLENVIVLDHQPGRDLLKVLDFGLAKSMKDPGSRATESGIVVGTPRYMSPEAAMNGVSSPAGDIYSLGVILGELVTGKPLWEGDNLPQLLGQKMEIGSTIVRIPGPLRTTLKAMLDPEPERRPTAAQARAMLVDVEAANAADTVFEAPPAGKATLDMRGSKVAVKEKSDPFAATRLLEKTPAAASSLSMAEELPSKPARRIALAVIIGAAAMVAIAAVIFVKMQSGPSTQAAAPRDAAVAMAPPIDAASIEVDAAPAVVTTKVRIETKPAGATVMVDGEAKTTPFDLELSVPMSLTATRKGYLATTFTVDPAKPLAPVQLKRKPLPKQQPDDSKSPF